MNYEFNSDRVRRIVGHLAQGGSLESIIQSVPREFYYYASERPSDGSFPLYEVVFFKSGESVGGTGMVTGQILKMKGLAPFTKTSFEIKTPASPFADLGANS